MKRLGSLLIFLLSLSIVLTACGGGGGGGATPPQQQVGTSSVKISGLVGSGVGGASISKAQTPTENPMANAIVEIRAYDKNGNQTDSVTTTTLLTGNFTANVKLSDSGGYLIVNVKRTGFTDYSKRIDFEKPSDVNISAILDSVVTAIANRSDAVFEASTGKKVIKFGLFKTAKGQKVVKVGREVDIRKQQGTNPNLEISIPVDVIPADTNTLVANLNSYDPTNSNEASRFPGQYRDSSGNPIVSLGFDFMNVTTDSGQSLGAAIAKARKQGKLKKSDGTDFITITRWIYGDNCKTLLRDADDLAAQYGVDTTGFNVPVYAYSSVRGLWDLLGIGTIDKDNDGVIESTDDVITTDIDGDDVMGGAGDYRKQCSDKGWEAIIIKIKSDDFLNNWNWCNLDYVVLEKPVQVCIEKTFINSDGKPIEGLWVNLFDDVDYVNDSTWSFSSAWGSTDANGKVTLSVVLTNSTTDEDLSGKISYYNPFDYSYQEESVTLGKSPNCKKLTNPPITKPPVCQVQGYLKDNTGAALSDQLLYIYSSNPYYYNYAYTDNNGYFIMDARCTTDHDVYVGWNWQLSARFNPDGTTTGYPNEYSDIGSTDNWLVTLKDIIIKNQKPYAYCWLSSTSLYASPTTTITAYIEGGDNECDTPLEWKLKKDGAEVDSGSEGCWFYEERSISFDTAGTYPVTLDVTDSKHRNDPTIADCGTVYVSGSGENRPPIIYYAYTNNYYPAKNTEITLWGAAYDWDSANLTSKWYADGSPLTNEGCSGNTSDYWFETACTYTTPNVDGKLIPIKFEVSDGTNTVSWEFEIYVGGVPGEFNIIIQKKGKR